MQLVDTHCHLFMEPLTNDVPAVLERAAARGVTRVVVPAYDQASWLKMAQFVGTPNVHAAAGLHPWVADAPIGGVLRPSDDHPGGAPDVTIDTAMDNAVRCSALRQALGGLLQGGLAVAVGEIGLDHKLDFDAGQPTPEQQLPILRVQLELAVDLDKPVILHCRGAFKELLDEIRRFDGRLRGVLHAYSRGVDPANDFVRAGLYIGLGGAITRDRAQRVRKAAAHLPLDRIVLETDAPSIGLDGVLPEETEPQHVRDVAEALARLRGETIETIAEVTTANACELFRLSD